MSTLFLALINFYQKYLSLDRGALRFLAPGGACKYQISCSEYTKQMIYQQGALKGMYKGIKRVVSCI